MRPIVSFINSPLYNLSKFLCKLLSPLAGNTEFTVKNSYEFVQFLNSIVLKKNECMVSFDVVSLFTNILCLLPDPRKAYPYPCELWIDNWLHTGMDKPLEDLVGDTKQRYWAIALGVLLRFLRFWDGDYQRSSPDFGNFEWAQARRKEASLPGL